MPGISVLMDPLVEGSDRQGPDEGSYVSRLKGPYPSAVSPIAEASNQRRTTQARWAAP
jgi:hypothetical protein